MYMKLYNTTKNQIIAKDLLVADTFYTRLKGLLGKSDLPKDTALWIKDCPSVHTFFMKFDIDVIFIDKHMRVTRVVENLKPWRFTRFFQYKNKSCIELSSLNQISTKVSKGDILNVRP